MTNQHTSLSVGRSGEGEGTFSGEVTISICQTREPCNHNFQGWRQFDDGCGGETVCSKCGIGAMAYTLSLDF